MSKREKIMDDAARVAGGAIGLMSGLATQTKASLRSRIDDMAQSMDLVPREDFEKLELMLAKSRAEQEDMKSRLKALEDAVFAAKKK
jgi:BMFP domain-containing protein YqiC